MNTISGAAGQRWLVVPYCWGFTCDLLAANEITNTEGQANPADWSTRRQQGVIYRSAFGTLRPRVRNQADMLRIIRENAHYQALFKLRKMSAEERAAKSNAAFVLKCARLNPEPPGLAGLSTIWETSIGYAAGIYG
jgi:hypothetical protein